jgi:hypothetical protein
MKNKLLNFLKSEIVKYKSLDDENYFALTIEPSKSLCMSIYIETNDLGKSLSIDMTFSRLIHGSMVMHQYNQRHLRIKFKDHGDELFDDILKIPNSEALNRYIISQSRSFIYSPGKRFKNMYSLWKKDGRINAGSRLLTAITTMQRTWRKNREYTIDMRSLLSMNTYFDDVTLLI